MTRLKVKSSDSRFGIRDAIEVNPLMFCEICGHVVRESEMRGDTCSICYNANEGRVNDPEPELKAQGDKALPVGGERELKPKALAGQLKLEL